MKSGDPELSMNLQHVALLALLDLSAAFDTVDHAILLERMTKSSGKVSEWFSSYLSGRSQRVALDGGVYTFIRNSFKTVPQCLAQLGRKQEQ